MNTRIDVIAGYMEYIQNKIMFCQQPGWQNIRLPDIRWNFNVYLIVGRLHHASQI